MTIAERMQAVLDLVILTVPLLDWFVVSHYDEHLFEKSLYKRNIEPFFETKGQLLHPLSKRGQRDFGSKPFAKGCVVSMTVATGAPIGSGSVTVIVASVC
jgi:hypothetical protein